MPQLNDLESNAKLILKNNWRDGFTIPSKRLYPFQWNWDSGFIALGYLHFDIPRALEEMVSLFQGQWSNGMLPHILFHRQPDIRYFPDADYWNSHLSAASPKNLKTSGITQPPIHGFVLEAIYRAAGDRREILEGVNTLFPKVVHLHQYLYSHRDPQHEGLVYIQHNWESGLDNAPMWDQPLQNINLKKIKVPAYQRADTSQVDPSQRPTQQDYDRYIHLVEIFKSNKYDDLGIAASSPFLVQDPNFNAILIRSNESLIRLGKVLSRDTTQLEEWQHQSIRQFNEKLWDQSRQRYQGYDLLTKQPLVSDGILGFLPLNSAAPGEARAADMVATLFNEYLQENHQPFPSHNSRSPDYDPRKYWRGPVWINTNWLLYQGLMRYGHITQAKRIRDSTLQLIKQYGFYEYFHPQANAGSDLGFGSDDFSWTAALGLDLLKSAT